MRANKKLSSLQIIGSSTALNTTVMLSICKWPTRFQLLSLHVKMAWYVHIILNSLNVGCANWNSACRCPFAYLAIPEGILGMTISLFTSARLLCNCSLFTNYEELFPPIGIQFQQKIRRSFLNTVKFKVAIVGNAKLRNTVAPNRLIQYFIHVHNTVSEI